jgi:iron complex transport system permease protein
MPAARRLALLGLALALSMAVAVAVGPTPVRASDVGRTFLHHLAGGRGPSVGADAIVWELRSPRTALAALCGAGLALVGAAMQAVVANPLADPYILGVSSGASVGAVGVMLWGAGASSVAVSTGAFAGALLAFAAVLVLAGGRAQATAVRMILAGVAIGYLGSALTSLLVLRAPSSQATRSVLRWLLGSFSGATWSTLPLVAGASVVAGGVILLRARRIDALLFGDEVAESVGVDAHRLRLELSVAATLLTAVLVAVSGAVGFVGLIVPHAARWWVGIGHRTLLPVTALIGAIFMVWADIGARVLFAPEELPVGLITTLVGAPAFIVLLARQPTA